MKYTITLRWTAEAETPEDGDRIMREAAKCREICRLVLGRPVTNDIEDSVEGTIDLAES